MKKYFILLKFAVALSVTVAAQNVGIGTNIPDPSAKLHIVSTSSGVLIPQLTTAQIGSIVNPANGLLVYDSSFKILMINAGTPALPNFTPIVTAKFGWLTQGNDNISAANFLGTTQNNSLRFRNNNIERMLIDSNGKFGVGVSDPLAAKFHIKSTGNNEVLRLQSTFPLISLYAGNNLHSSIWANGSYLDISTASGSNLGLSFSPNATQQMTINYNGDVGIGTVSPAEKLHVVGNLKADTIKPGAVKFTPNAGNGKILTSDATGNASWQDRSTGGGVGFGSWGDCSMNGVSEFNPVADTSGASNDYFGNSVSISGNYAIVGAYQDDIGANADQGSASIYQYNGCNWVLMQKITDATGDTNDFFGTSVSISGNYAIVGAPYDNVGANGSQGSVSIYQYLAGSWVLMQKITDATGAASDFFGFSVSISGNYAIVGAYGDDVGANANQGSASIYQWNGSSWALMQKITDATGATNDFFGNSVSISGNYTIVGALGDNVGANTDQGSASIYQWNGSNWVLMQKITDADGADLDAFGVSVSIFGNYTIVGANRDNVGANTDQGSASIYQYNGSSWVLMQKITDASGAGGDSFGYSVSISGNYAIVGANQDDVGANADQGSASIYVRVGLGWQRLQYVVDPGGNANDQFGYGTAIDGTNLRFLVGANGYANSSGKAVFGKVN
jgi:hypothetical protein